MSTVVPEIAAQVAFAQRLCPPAAGRLPLRLSGDRSPFLRAAQGQPARNKREMGTRQWCSRIPGAVQLMVRAGCHLDDGVVVVLDLFVEAASEPDA